MERIEGSFVVRQKDRDHFLAVKSGEVVKHIPIRQVQDKLRFANCPKFESKTLGKLIERGIRFSRKGRHIFSVPPRIGSDMIKIQMLYPIQKSEHNRR